MVAVSGPEMHLYGTASQSQLIGSENERWADSSPGDDETESDTRSRTNPFQMLFFLSNGALYGEG